MPFCSRCSETQSNCREFAAEIASTGSSIDANAASDVLGKEKAKLACVAGARRGRGIGEIRRALELEDRTRKRVDLPFRASRESPFLFPF